MASDPVSVMPTPIMIPLPHYLAPVARFHPYAPAPALAAPATPGAVVVATRLINVRRLDRARDVGGIRRPQLNTSVPVVGSFSNASMSAKRARNKASTWAVLQFPVCSQ